MRQRKKDGIIWRGEKVMVIANRIFHTEYSYLCAQIEKKMQTKSPKEIKVTEKQTKKKT